jgi:sugar phosphate isomerase/epimerase
MLTALCITVSVQAGAGEAKKHLGIATYSVKGLESDIEGSLKSLADAGYAVMEISNYNAAKSMVATYSLADYAALVKKYGMTIISSHARAKFDVKDEAGSLAAWGKLFDDHKILGCKYVIFPMNMWSNTMDALKAECALMNKIGEEANKRGIKFGYHNHSFEFATVPGTDMMFEDFLIANTDPSKVFFQMDVYWTTQGGQNPVDYLKKYPTRIKVLHIKDDYVIGESGAIDYKAIFTQFYKNGGEDWFVEIESKMTPEQKAMMAGMMEQMKARMSGQQPAAPAAGAPPAGAPPAGGQGGARSGAPQGMPGMGPQDPKVVAENLKESLSAITLSAEYLKKSDFVK